MWYTGIYHTIFKNVSLYLFYAILVLIILLPEYFDVYYTFLFDIDVIAIYLSEIYSPTFEMMFKYLE